MYKPLTVNSYYPDLDKLEKDEYSAHFLSFSYASSHGELKAILQYCYHALFFKSYGLNSIADTLYSIAIAEMEHLSLLGTALIKLGANPTYNETAFDKYNFFSTDCISFSNRADQMILDDIAEELSAVKTYDKLLKKLKNPTLLELVRQIKLDEELHLKTLNELYNARTFL